MGFKCVYCGKEFEGYGNNPDTTWDDKEWKENDRCLFTWMRGNDAAAKPVADFVNGAL